MLNVLRGIIASLDVQQLYILGRVDFWAMNCVNPASGGVQPRARVRFAQFLTHEYTQLSTRQEQKLICFALLCPLYTHSVVYISKAGSA